ncbi:replication protein [Paraburkholderia sediminicola]|uniref:replication protein n=1 Tax=Paraburkholderia sediminicola TaxID=458836 RepID=UPI0038B9C9C3
MALAEVIHLPEQVGPQTQDGFTRIANELLDALLFARLTGQQLAVVMAVVRKTYGFNKRSDDIGLSQIRKMTNIDKANLSRTVAQLVDLRILHRADGEYAHTLSLNKHYRQWAVAEHLRLSIQQPPVVENTTSPVVESTTEGLSNQQPQKTTPKDTNQKTTPKENLSPSLRERFDIFWAAYPKKKSKTTAEKAFAKLKPNEQLFNDLMAGLERAKTSGQWVNPQFIPHAATWLNAGGWMDEIQTAYTDAELAVIRAFNKALGERIGAVDEAVFVEPRAGAIRAFMTHLKGDVDAWARYFPAVRDKVDLPPHAGFDYLISPKGFGDVKGRMAVKRNPDGTRVVGEWDKSASGIRAMAIEMGVPFTDEDPMPAVAARVRAAIAKQEGNA